jgi:hypothetical protein
VAGGGGGEKYVAYVESITACGTLAGAAGRNTKIKGGGIFSRNPVARSTDWEAMRMWVPCHGGHNKT